MTPAELKTIRESLGLPLKWVADQARVQLRTAQYWESGHTGVPEDVAAMLTALDDQVWSIVAQGLEQIKAAADSNEGLPEEVVLIRYRSDADLWAFHPEFEPIPASTHAMLVSRMRRKLWEIGVPSVIQYMSPKEYSAWLEGREDSDVLRAEWAASLPT